MLARSGRPSRAEAHRAALSGRQSGSSASSSSCRQASLRTGPASPGQQVAARSAAELDSTPLGLLRLAGFELAAAA